MERDFIAERAVWDETKRRRNTIEILRDQIVTWFLEQTKPRVGLSAVVMLTADIFEKCAELRALEAIENGPPT